MGKEENSARFRWRGGKGGRSEYRPSRSSQSLKGTWVERERGRRRRKAESSGKRVEKILCLNAQQSHNTGK